jgi:microsomal dipeptidase-like Zn-dependent dipeptidase
MNTSPKQDWKKLHEEASIVDLHAHPVLKALLFRRSLSRLFAPTFMVGDLNPIDVQTAFPLLEEGDIDVLISVAYPLEKRLFNDVKILNVIPLSWIRNLPFTLVKKVWAEVITPPYFKVANTMLDMMEQAVKAYNDTHPKRAVHFAHSGDELQSLLKQPDKPIVLIHGMEGGHSLEGEIGLKHNEQRWDELTPTEQEALAEEVLANLDSLAKRGVAYLVLAHFYPNKLIMPVFPYPEHLALSIIPRDKLENVWHDVNLTEGLTELGRRVVRRMIEIGMLIDISHATPKARQDIYKLVEESNRKAPIVIATHVGAYAINPSPYNLADWEIQWIADHHGIVGVIFMTYWLMPTETKFGLNFISRTIEHILQVAGEDVIGFGTDFDGADPPDDLVNESKLFYLTERLYSEYSVTGQRKYTDEQIKKILGGNAVRVLMEGWGKT